MNYYEHHIRDYDADTAHLSWLEDMAYTRLLRMYYRKEQPIPNDIAAVCRLVRARSRAEKAAVETVLREFFTLGDDGWHHDRCDQEIASYRARQEKAARSAEARWAAPRAHATKAADAELKQFICNTTESNGDSPSDANASSDQCDADANAMLSECEGNALQTPDTRHQTPTHPSDAPVLKLLPSVGACGAAQNAAPPASSAEAAQQAPPTPPPPFDGTNAEVLNGRCVVALADGFELPAQWGFDAEALGFKASEVIREAERFRQYWTQGKGKGTRRSVKGWRQSWSNWLAKAERNIR